MTYYANSADPVQMRQNAASDQGLHHLLTAVSIQNTVKMKIFTRNPYLKIVDTLLVSKSSTLNPIALRKAKIVYSFGLSECNRVKAPKMETVANSTESS